MEAVLAEPLATSWMVAASATGLTKIYGEGNTRVVALDAVDVAFEAGKLTAIMGPSGSGKSTLLHCLAGLDAVTSGEVRILVPTLTAEENIQLPLLLGGQQVDPEWEAQVVDALALDDRLHHRPDELSGGQQQRVAVASALVTRPNIIVADEPTGNLDSASGQEVLGFLRSAVDKWNQTVVMVTHDPVAASYADLVVFLRDGRLVDRLESPTPDKVLDMIKSLEA